MMRSIKSHILYYTEKYYPFALSIIAIVFIIKYRSLIPKLNDLVDEMCNNGLSISVTLTGFFLTILTIINSIDTRRMRFVRQMDGYPRLMSYLRSSINYNIILLATSFLVKYISHRQLLNFDGVNIIDNLYIFLFIYTILLSFRFTRIFISLLTDPTPPRID